MSFSAREIHFDRLAPQEPSRRNPSGISHNKVAVSFDYYTTGSWITLRAGNDEIDLTPDEQRELVKLLVGRFPLDALSGI